MNRKSIWKRGLSLVLCIVMLVSCWVFTAAPQANAERHGKTAYNYKIEVETTNTADCNDKEIQPTIALYGTDESGAESEMFNNSIDYDYIQKKQTYTVSGTSDKFPSRIYGTMYLDAWGWRKWVGELRIYIDGVKVMNQECVCETSGLPTAQQKNFEGKVATGNMPTPRNCYFTKTPTATITAPRIGEANYVEDIGAEVIDQYGVILSGIQPRITVQNSINGLTVTNESFTVSSSCHSADGSDQTYTIKVLYQDYGESFSGKIINASYTYQFQDENGNNIPNASGTLKYGQGVPTPTAPAKAYTDKVHYNFRAWDHDTIALQGDTVFKPLYKSETHTLGDFEHDKDSETCTQDGTKTKSCTCGYSITETDPGTALGHDFSIKEVTLQPGCATTGTELQTCSRCGQKRTVTLDATNHNYVAGDPIAPTCENKGYTVYTCTKCQDSYEADFVDALGHDYENGTVLESVDPWCETAGYTIKKCSRCEQTERTDFEALGHDFRSWNIATAATCLENGSRISTCARCQQTYAEPIIAPGHHEWSEWTGATEPDCTHGSIATRECSVCHQKETEELDPLGHDWVLKCVNPDDGDNGLMYFKCQRAGCGNYATCEVNEQGQTVVGKECATLAEAKLDTAEVPATTFNTFVRPQSHYNYIIRGGSLKIDFDGDNNVQILRFSSSVFIPDDVELIDFGYIYAASENIKNFDHFLLGGKNVLSCSVFDDPDGKYSTYKADGGEIKTFNLAIAVEDKDGNGHWEKDISARPYVIYKYAGQIYTIHDQIYAEKSITEIAAAALNSPNETRRVKQYIQNKIGCKYDLANY